MSNSESAPRSSQFEPHFGRNTTCIRRHSKIISELISPDLDSESDSEISPNFSAVSSTITVRRRGRREYYHSESFDKNLQNNSPEGSKNLKLNSVQNFDSLSVLAMPTTADLDDDQSHAKSICYSNSPKNVTVIRSQDQIKRRFRNNNLIAQLKFEDAQSGCTIFVEPDETELSAGHYLCQLHDKYFQDSQSEQEHHSNSLHEGDSQFEIKYTKSGSPFQFVTENSSESASGSDCTDSNIESDSESESELQPGTTSANTSTVTDNVETPMNLEAATDNQNVSIPPPATTTQTDNSTTVNDSEADWLLNNLMQPQYQSEQQSQRVSQDSRRAKAVRHQRRQEQDQEVSNTNAPDSESDRQFDDTMSNRIHRHNNYGTSESESQQRHYGRHRLQGNRPWKSTKPQYQQLTQQGTAAASRNSANGQIQSASDSQGDTADNINNSYNQQQQYQSLSDSVSQSQSNQGSPAAQCQSWFRGLGAWFWNQSSQQHDNDNDDPDDLQQHGQITTGITRPVDFAETNIITPNFNTEKMNFQVFMMPETQGKIGQQQIQQQLAQQLQDSGEQAQGQQDQQQPIITGAQTLTDTPDSVKSESKSKKQSSDKKHKSKIDVERTADNNGNNNSNSLSSSQKMCILIVCVCVFCLFSVGSLAIVFVVSGKSNDTNGTYKKKNRNSSKSSKSTKSSGSRIFKSGKTSQGGRRSGKTGSSGVVGKSGKYKLSSDIATATGNIKLNHKQMNRHKAAVAFASASEEVLVLRDQCPEFYEKFIVYQNQQKTKAAVEKSMQGARIEKKRQQQAMNKMMIGKKARDARGKKSKRKKVDDACHNQFDSAKDVFNEIILGNYSPRLEAAMMSLNEGKEKWPIDLLNLKSQVRSARSKSQSDSESKSSNEKSSKEDKNASGHGKSHEQEQKESHGGTQDQNQWSEDDTNRRMRTLNLYSKHDQEQIIAKWKEQNGIAKGADYHSSPVYQKLKEGNYDTMQVKQADQHFYTDGHTDTTAMDEDALRQGNQNFLNYVALKTHENPELLDNPLKMLNFMSIPSGQMAQTIGTTASTNAFFGKDRYYLAPETRKGIYH